LFGRFDKIAKRKQKKEIQEDEEKRELPTNLMMAKIKPKIDNLLT